MFQKRGPKNVQERSELDTVGGGRTWVGQRYTGLVSLEKLGSFTHTGLHLKPQDSAKNKKTGIRSCRFISKLTNLGFYFH